MLDLAPAARTAALPQRPERPQARSFLPEVQALRALAVSLVVLYHFWPERLTGGFVGVDVFFVISGFLITSHLYREVATRGRISLAAFYARRARRLLPASMLVLLVTAAASFVYLPVTRWTTTAADILASTFYVQNWVLADRAVDYSALGHAASAVQHFWSLSVEEQFYLAWPPLILLLLLLARQLPTVRRDSLMLAGILAVSALSLAYSVYATATDPAAAYFVTPTRIWELGAGAAFALWSQGRMGRPVLSRSAGLIALRWAGLAAILVSAVTLSAASAFPGYLALVPVLGTVAVIAAGDTGPRDPLSALTGFAPVQFLGDVSYAFYLWHWPVIVMAPFVLERTPVATDKLVLIALCIGLAWLTKVLVEAPTQKWRLLARPVLAAAFTVAAMVVVSGVAALQFRAVEQREDAARAQLLSVEDDPCFGAAALAADAQCADVFATPAVLGRVAGDEPWFEDPACEVTEAPLRVATCRWGSGTPTAKVALVGDSHAEHWRGALHRLAEANGWEIVEMFRAACPVTAVPVLTFSGSPIDTEGCRDWGQQVNERLVAEAPDAVFTSAFAGAFGFEGTDPEQSLATGAQGFVDIWTEWADAGPAVFVLRDPPTTGGRDIPECLATHAGSPLECASPRDEAVRPDAMTVAASQIDSPRVQLIDLTDYFCDETTCYAAIGQATVYQDLDHISAPYSRSLAPYLLDRIGVTLG